ncbi:MAG TPA: OpgC domain-containing protein [Steroidobacteraceae bacterium]|nr:OpgC domain-containing protein [Steroidobacteraceae bacterium]
MIGSEPATSAGGRDVRLDSLRGFFLVVMAGVHVPTPLSHWLHEPFGYLSAAEGFVFLGACLAGLIFGRARRQEGDGPMRARVYARVRTIYQTHLGLVLAAVLLAWWLARWVRPLAYHFHPFLMHPVASLALIPLLLHQPPLFDILPLYVVFLGLTPWWLRIAARRGWVPMLAVSAAVWLLAQFHPGAAFVRSLEDRVPIELGSFNLLGWQLLWIIGLAFGETMGRDPGALTRHRHRLLVPALILVVAGVYLRHRLGHESVAIPSLPFWINKWRLGPARLLNFLAWAALLWSWNPRPPRRLMAPTVVLGRHSLAVFAAHIPLAIAATSVLQMHHFGEAARIAIGFAVIGALFVFAQLLDRRARAGA